MIDCNPTIADVIASLKKFEPDIPGICKVCSRDLPEKFYQVEGKDYPVVTCENAIKIYPDALEAMAKGKSKWEIECPPLYKEIDMGKPYKYPKIDQFSYRKVQEWQYGQKGMTLVGDTGTGKSTSIWKALRRFDAQSIPWVVYAGKKLAVSHVDSFRSNSTKEFIDKLHKIKILVLDDLGKESFTEAMESLIFDIINARTENQLPVWVTTRFPIKGCHGEFLLQNRFNDRVKGRDIVRRLLDFSETIMFK